MRQNDPAIRLLILSLPFQASPEQLELTLNTASQISDWPICLRLAERHGMAPLLYRRLNESGAVIPTEARRDLQALTLRHRLAAQARSDVLGALFAAFEQAGVKLLTLKGCALAYSLYPSAGLRPMRDIDLLVASDSLQKAAGIMRAEGFLLSMDGFDPNHSRHLPSCAKQHDGFTISVEIHFCLFQHRDGTPWFGMDDLSKPPLPFTLPNGQPAAAPGHEDMLHHLCRHAFFINNGFDPLRWSSAADILNYAENHAGDIDWDAMRRDHPEVLHTLRAFHAFTPLSPALLSKAGIQPAAPSADAGVDYRGWPTRALSEWRTRGRLKFLADTLFPPQWWLWLHHGGGENPRIWYHWGNLVFEFAQRIKSLPKGIKK